MKFFRMLFGLLAAPLCALSMSVLPIEFDQQASHADATGVATLVASQVRMHNQTVQTRFVFRTVEALRGDFPAYFEVYSPGGLYQGKARADSRLPALRPEATYLIFLKIKNQELRFQNGGASMTLIDSVDLSKLRHTCTELQPGADLTPYATEPITIAYMVSTPTSGLQDFDGFRRFTAPDRGTAIPVYADISTRPTGVSAQDALLALENAMAAWEASSTVLLELVDTVIFSQSAEDYNSDDGLILRVQFHDNFGRISDGSSMLGFGGSSYRLDPGNGGTVAGTPFNPASHGYVVLDHSKATLSNLDSLEEVLTHEIGHALGLAHSSLDPDEADPDLADAIMYYQLHGDERGATLSTYDSETILKAYPLNTPPFGFDRLLDAVTFPENSTLTHPEVNQIEIVGFDLQGQSLSFIQDSAIESNGSFSLEGATVTFTPSGYYGDTSIDDPLTQYYDLFRGRLSDGTNLSPFIEIRVVGFRADSQPYGSADGIPDSWMSTYFGSSNGSNATDDNDEDGLSNLEEFLLGTDPTDSSSAFQVTQFSGSGIEWSARQFDLYALEASSDLTTWYTVQLVQQENSDGSLSITDLPDPDPGSALFFRVNRIH